MGAGEILRTSCNKYTAFMALVAHTERARDQSHPGSLLQQKQMGRPVFAGL